jgi:hypothetical protein
MREIDFGVAGDVDSVDDNEVSELQHRKSPKPQGMTVRTVKNRPCYQNYRGYGFRDHHETQL